MYKLLKTLIFSSALVVGIAAAPVLYAQSSKDTPSPQVFAMGQGHMTGYGNMRGQLDQMMAAHIDMMQTMMNAHGAWRSDDE